MGGKITERVRHAAPPKKSKRCPTARILKIYPFNISLQHGIFGENSVCIRPEIGSNIIQKETYVFMCMCMCMCIKPDFCQKSIKTS